MFSRCMASFVNTAEPAQKAITWQKKITQNEIPRDIIFSQFQIEYFLKSLLLIYNITHYILSKQNVSLLHGILYTMLSGNQNK
jgi:hypothetical protein